MGRNMLREYLQYKTLESIYGSSFGRHVSFMGGTCIHLIHGSPRFSEDLDFDNLGLSQENFASMAKLVQKDFLGEGYRVEVKVSGKKALTVAIRFADILQRNGLSGHRDEKLLLKIDAEPQEFPYERVPGVLNRFDVLSRVFSIPPGILLAQKFACILMRPRPLGRDYYDAAFLLGKVRAHGGYLKAKVGILDAVDLKSRLLHRCQNVNLAALAKDMEPFVTNPKEARKTGLFGELILSKEPAELYDKGD